MQADGALLRQRYCMHIAQSYRNIVNLFFVWRQINYSYSYNVPLIQLNIYFSPWGRSPVEILDAESGPSPSKETFSQ
jgi:hypothetical protein